MGTIGRTKSVAIFIFMVTLVAPKVCSITTTHHDKPEESKLQTNHSNVSSVSNETLPVAERQKRLLPYVNFYLGHNYNQPTNVENYERPAAYLIVPSKNVYYKSNNKSPANPLLNYRNKGKVTPFLDSNALPGPFVPITRSTPRPQQLELSYVSIPQRAKIPNYSAIYDKLSQMKFNQRNRPNFQDSTPYLGNVKPQISYVPVRGGSMQENYKVIAPTKTIVETFTATNIDIPSEPEEDYKDYGNLEYEHAPTPPIRQYGGKLRAQQQRKPFVHDQIAIELPQGSFVPDYYKSGKQYQIQTVVSKKPVTVIRSRERNRIKPQYVLRDKLKLTRPYSAPIIDEEFTAQKLRPVTKDTSVPVVEMVEEDVEYPGGNVPYAIVNVAKILNAAQRGNVHGLRKIPQGVRNNPHTLGNEGENPHTIENIVPYSVENIPYNGENIPHNVGNIPHNVENIPHNIENIPHNLENIPLKDEKIRYNAEKNNNKVEKIPHNVEILSYEVENPSHDFESLVDAKKNPHNVEIIRQNVQRIPYVIKNVHYGLKKIPQAFKNGPRIVPDSVDGVHHGFEYDESIRPLSGVRYVIGNVHHSGANIPHPSTNTPYSGANIPHSSAKIPHSDENIPHSNTNVPHTGVSYDGEDIPDDGANNLHDGADIPHDSVNIPHAGSNVPHPGGNFPHPGGNIPRGGANIPHSAGKIPNSGDNIPHSIGNIPHSIGNIPHSIANIPHSETNIPHSEVNSPNFGASAPNLNNIPQTVENILHSVEKAPHSVEGISHPVDNTPHTIENVPYATPDEDYRPSGFPNAATEVPYAVSENPHAVPEIPHSVPEFPHAVTEIPHTVTQIPHLPTENSNTLGLILKKLQDSNTLPKTLTPDNIDNSIRTLVKILNSLNKKKKFSKPIVVAEEHENYNEDDADNEAGVGISGRPEEIPGTLIQNFPADTVEGGTPGKPGVDYPALYNIPQTSFSCKTQRYKGFFGDPDTNCQVWHYCDLNGGQASFLCPNGTIFSQVALTCDWWYNVKCSSTPQLYVLNERLYKYIIPLVPKFPEDYSGPLVDKYLALKFQEMEEKMKKEKEEKEKSESKDESSEETTTEEPTTAEIVIKEK